jgi:hypothetical protein
MVETDNQFKKKPRRVGDKGRRVSISPEAKLAYEAEIKAREDREQNYLRHLPGPDNKPNR